MTSSIRTALLVLLFVHVTRSAGPVCYSCSRLPHPWDCDTVVQCNTNEDCFVDQFVTTSGKILYSSGCAPKSKCSAVSGRRQIKTASNINDVTNNIYDVTNQDDDIVTCTKCCNDTNFCNHELCDIESQTPHPGQQYCLYCPNVLTPEDCEHVVLCNIDEVCFTEFVILNGEQRYRLGCSPKQSCQQTESRQSLPLIGRKRALQIDTSMYCGSCCDGINCNRELCRPGNNQTINGGNVFELVTSPARNDLCNDISNEDCLNDIKQNSSLCQVSGYKNYACRQSCGTCAATTSKPVVDPTDCFYESTRYMGQRSTTLSGKTCLSWQDVGQSNAMLDSAENRCRDPDGRGYPWCYTSLDQDWEYCQVPYCQECYYTRQSRNYTGYVSTAINGQTCLPWTNYQSQIPGIIDSMFPDGTVAAAKNFCRDFNGTGVISCFTGTTLSQCDVRECLHECRDSPDTSTNCALVEKFICTNEYLSVTLCPKTCDICSFGLLPQQTIVPEDICVDVPEANCPTLQTIICSDNEASLRLCPKTCHRCKDILSTTPMTTTVSTPLMTSSTITSLSTTQVSLPSAVNSSVQTTVSTQGPTTVQSPSPTTVQSPSPTTVQSTSTTTPYWLPWGSWNCIRKDSECYHARLRYCSTQLDKDCDGNHYEIEGCVNNTCDDGGDSTTAAMVTSTLAPATTQLTTLVPGDWLSWGSWSCKKLETSCYHVRYRNCSIGDVSNCNGNSYFIKACINNSCEDNGTSTTAAIVKTTLPPATTQLTTSVPGDWLSWGSWNCVTQNTTCYHVRYRNCSVVNSTYCSGNNYLIKGCDGDTCEDTCKDNVNADGLNGCQPSNLEIICDIKSVAWQTCRKSCDLCDSCWDYLDCSTKGAKELFCRNDTFALQYCRQSCNKCTNKPVDVTLSKCGDPVKDDSLCASLQKDLCICSDADVRSLCSNFCANSCEEYPLTAELRNCTPLPNRRRRDLILSQTILV